MSIKCNLSTLMGKYRYTIKQVSEKTGLARSTITVLYHDTAKRVNYDTVEKLCELFNCTVADIFEYEKKK